ncbi:MAG: glycosyltransferase family 39 protein [Bacilli bacterium]|nr:glycosyltransferase family 39 protein [Bacilli bacterium]
MKFNNFLSKVFIYVSIIVLSIISLIFLIKNNFLISLILFLVVIFISLKENIKKFPLILFITSLIIRIIVIIVANFPQVYDFKILLDASKAFSISDYSFNQWDHFSMWGYQTGFVIYQGLILKLIENEIILKILNAIYSSSLVLIIYAVAKKISTERSARIVSLLYMIFPFSLVLNTVLANHHLSTLLMYIGILFLIKDEKHIKDYVFAAILISLGNIIRPEGIIVVCSLLLYEFFRLKKDLILDTVKKISVFLIVYFLIGTTSSLIIQKSGINPVGLKNTNPLWKFVLGFNHDTCGYYSGDDVIYQKDKKMEMDIIKERISKNPAQMGKLFACKIDHFWLLSDMSMESGAFNDKEISVLGINIKYNLIEDIVLTVNKFIYIITFFMCIISVIIKRGQIVKDKSFFFVILMIVTFFVYLLIEIQPRYSYFIHICIFILASYSFEYLLNVICNIKNKITKNVNS